MSVGKMKIYTLISTPANNEDLKAGDAVYEMPAGSEVVAPGDTRLDGVEYLYVTTSPIGNSPGFSASISEIDLTL